MIYILQDGRTGRVHAVRVPSGASVPDAIWSTHESLLVNQRLGADCWARWTADKPAGADAIALMDSAPSESFRHIVARIDDSDGLDVAWVSRRAWPTVCRWLMVARG